MPDGWFRTGDMDTVDAKAASTSTGRIKSMIVLTNGKRGFPERAGALINQIPGVKGKRRLAKKSQRDAVDIVRSILIDREKNRENPPDPLKHSAILFWLQIQDQGSRALMPQL